MEIHYKTTMWCKIILDETKISKEEVLQKLNEGYSPSEIGFDNDIDSEWEVIEDTEEFITPAENDGQSLSGKCQLISGSRFPVDRESAIRYRTDTHADRPAWV